MLMCKLLYDFKINEVYALEANRDEIEQIAEQKEDQYTLNVSSFNTRN